MLMGVEVVIGQGRHVGQIIREDLRLKTLSRESAKDCVAWRTAIRKPRLTHTSMEKAINYFVCVCVYTFPVTEGITSVETSVYSL